MDGTTITAIGSLIIALTGLIVGIITNRSAATKAEADSLRQTIQMLQVENERLRRRLDEVELDHGETLSRLRQVEQENVVLLERLRIQDGKVKTLEDKVRALTEENNRLKGRRKASE